MDYNKVLIIGRLGADPDPKTNSSGSQSVLFSLANTMYSKNQENGEIVTRTIWHKVTVWGDKLVQKCLTMNKGDLVLVEGYLDYNTIKKENSQTGESSTVTKIIVSSYKQGRVELFQKKTKVEDTKQDETKVYNNFYNNKTFKNKKDFQEEFLEEDGF